MLYGLPLPFLSVHSHLVSFSTIAQHGISVVVPTQPKQKIILLPLIPIFSLSVSSVHFPSRILPKSFYILLFILISEIILKTTTLNFLGPCNSLEIGLLIFAFAPCLPLTSYLMRFPRFAVSDMLIFFILSLHINLFLPESLRPCCFLCLKHLFLSFSYGLSLVILISFKAFWGISPPPGVLP